MNVTTTPSDVAVEMVTLLRSGQVEGALKLGCLFAGRSAGAAKQIDCALYEMGGELPRVAAEWFHHHSNLLDGMRRNDPEHSAHSVDMRASAERSLVRAVRGVRA